MAVLVRVPGPLRKLTGGQGKAEVAAGTVQQILCSLCHQFEGLQGRLFDESGALRSTVRVFVGEQDIRGLSDLETTVADGATVSIVLPVAGA